MIIVIFFKILFVNIFFLFYFHSIALYLGEIPNDWKSEIGIISNLKERFYKQKIYVRITHLMYFKF